MLQPRQSLSSATLLVGLSLAAASIAMNRTTVMNGGHGGQMMARHKTLGDFVHPMQEMLAGELAKSATLQLQAAWGQTLKELKPSPVVPGEVYLGDLTSDAQTKLKSYADEAKWTVTGLTSRLQWQYKDKLAVANYRNAYVSPLPDQTLSAILGYSSSPAPGDTAINVWNTIRGNLKHDLEKALEPFYDSKVDNLVIAAAVEAIEASIERSVDDWVCSYNRGSGTFQWYNRQTGMWGGECFK
jgi:hypothetical protein